MFGLSFLSPLFLAGALAAAVPLAVHLFHRRSDAVVEFAAMRYLHGSAVQQARHRRLRELLLLALRCAAMALLAVAFARPYLSSTASAMAAPVTLVLADVSASLSAPGQIDRVRELAREAVRGAPPTHAVGVAAFGDRVELLAPISADRAAARAAIERLTVNHGATRYRAALASAAELMRGRTGRLVLITDLQQSGWDAADAGGVPADVSLDIRDAGAPASNVAVLSLTVAAGEAVARVRSFAPARIETMLALAVDGRSVDARPVSLDAGASAEVRIPLAGTLSGAVTATVRDEVGYASDNVRYAVLDPGRRTPVLIVTSAGATADALYVERALAAESDAPGIATTVLTANRVAALAAPELQAHALVLVVGSRGLDHRGRQRLAGYVRAGGALLLAADPEVDAAAIAAEAGAPLAVTWPDAAVPRGFAPDDWRHPLFRVFQAGSGFEQATFRRTPQLRVDGGQVLARFTDSAPALVEQPVGRGRLLVFGSDLSGRNNDLPLQPLFVPLLHELVRYTAGSAADARELLVGDTLDGRRPGPGVVTTSARDGTPGRLVAVNVAATESDPARLSLDEFRAGIPTLQARAARQAEVDAREREDGQRLWQFGLLLMVMTLVAEGVVARHGA